MTEIVTHPASLLKSKYEKEVKPELLKKFGYKSAMQLPKIQKVVLNMGVGEGANDKKLLESAKEQLSLIANQAAVMTYARKSIAGFKIREGFPLGCKVTLRSHQMWAFLDRLVHVALPRARDFRGLSTRSFDGRGNYALGIKEQIVFPEIDFDKAGRVLGLDIVINTSAPTNEEALELLRLLGFPFTQR